jgi:uncharacterized membrane protein
MQKTIGITLCVIGAIILAVLSTSAGDWYWLFLIAAALLGVVAGLIKNLPNRPD